MRIVLFILLVCFFVYLITKLIKKLSLDEPTLTNAADNIIKQRRILKNQLKKEEKMVEDKKQTIKKAKQKIKKEKV